MYTKNSGKSVKGLSIIEYALEAYRHHGVGHIFGVPGDFTLSACAYIEKSELELIVCRNELNAAYAAEAYARASGLGVVTATYGVGAYSAINGIALANAEDTPLVMFTGSPGVAERINDPEVHHKSGPFENQAETFRLHTVSSAVIRNPLTAFAEIDRVLNDVTLHKRPGYIEILRDMIDIIPATEYTPQKIIPITDEKTLGVVLEESLIRIARAKHPVIVAGVELHRFGLQDQLLRVLEKTGIPLATTLLGKSVIAETHEQFIGLYAGGIGDKEVARFVEESDCPIFIGAFMSDINMGRNPKFDRSRCIIARNGHFQFGEKHHYGVQLADYLPKLAETAQLPKNIDLSFRSIPPAVKSQPKPDDPISVDWVMSQLNERLDQDTVVICDIGDSLFAALDLRIPGRSAFLANAYYACMGHAIPGAVGVHFALPEMRKVVLCGDGAFQMTFQEISTAIQYKMPLVVLVLDNCGYETERRLFPGDWKFNDIPQWNYSRAVELFCGGKGFLVSSVGEFHKALDQAWESKDVSVIHLKLPKHDASRTLDRLAKELEVPKQ